ncbi:MAG: hypothetical protein OHK0029_13400 [Armatimonadaceae bacterium]
MSLRYGLTTMLLLLAALPALTQTDPPMPWENATYTDEAGFLRRTAPMLSLLAKESVGLKCMANSTCPDTGLLVKTFAVEGEEIISPYTGRRYKQGETGYFGPKKRGEDGQITAFGGDPLKRDLPPATARFLLGQEDAAVKAFLSIPGSLRQHYHFATVNWCRFYPLVSQKMSPEWHRAFRDAVAVYSESRRPSDGARENLPLPKPHDLIGVPGELLGGPVEAGGTENHKTMWRTSGLLYAQWFGPDAKVSGYSAGDAIRLIYPMLTGYLQTILTVGNGEYDSSTYYSHSLRAYLNVFDYSPDPKSRLLAKAMLDYYMVSYGLKMLNGVHAGAIKRGWAGDGDTLNGDGMDPHVWVWIGDTTVPADPGLITSIHQITTTYRPNRVIGNIIRKNVPLPFEAEIARPTYHSKDKNAFQETFYCSPNFALGSVAMTMVDNPTQQTIWSLVCKDKTGSLVFGGGQPRFRHPEGHSPYTQVVQKKGALLLLTGPTRKADFPNRETKSRQDNAAEALINLPAPASDSGDDLAAWWENAPKANASWLFVPRRVSKTQTRDGILFMEAGDTLIAVRTVGGTPYWVAPKPEGLPKAMQVLEKYRVLVVPADAQGYSGYSIEAVERAGYETLERFAEAVVAKTRQEAPIPTLNYRALDGTALSLTYQPAGLRATGTINGKPIAWEQWADGGVYKSPYLTIKEGVMTVRDGKEGYTMRLSGEVPVWKMQ